MRIHHLILAFACLSMAASPAFAADKKTPEERMKAFGTANPHAPKLEEMAKKLYQGISQEEAKRLVILRNGYSMIRTVEVVKGEVSKTVDLCGKANPPMKDDLKSHYAKWQDMVMPKVEDQHKRMDKILTAENFTRPDDVRAFLDQLDKTADYAADENEKTVVRVTDKEACGALIKSMDENGPKLVEALDKIVWPNENTQSPKAK
jgi:hypothetical protein